ncbi:MAG TPA: hypothetical protein VLM90_11695 [Candidatus Deferrimicrobium sp.]|nr:hypothetical protein [Candidatus Deferrimicrobium sp.]
MQKWIKRSRYGRLMFANDYSRAAKLVNGSKEYFSTNQSEIAVRIDISILDADIRAQDMFQEKSRSVIPAQAGIQTHHPPGYRFSTV